MKRLRFSRRAVVLGSALTGVAAAAYFVLRPRTREQQIGTVPFATAVSVQLAGSVTVQNAGVSVAAADEQDLRVVLRRGDAGIDPIGEVIAGRSTVGIVSAIQFMIARGKGAPIVAFGAELLDSPIAFFALESSKIDSPTDFRGLRVPRQQGSDAAVIYDAVLANLDISRGEIKERDVAGTTTMLVDKSIDILPGDFAETSYQLMKAGVAYTALRPADYGIHVPGSVYFTTEGMLRDHPSIISKFLGRVVSGWHQVYAGGQSIVGMVSSAAQVTRDRAEFELKAQRDLVLPVERRIAEFDELQWKQLRIVLLQERLVREETDFASAVNYSILKDVYRRPLSFGQ